ncbi:hypothetical protein HMI54_015298 [Coelomomyces lativittatus]|nr:hypothetical protein HMI56_001513 [Coelomomyces lativittatus]KAJ1512998.1 hypothetical protein HMI54_015298 [Coelomomyces lativittatus]
MYGFVDALVIADDPEYHWSDSFRTPRSSNEARQKLLFRLSGRLRRILGKKALEQGGNAILGLHQYFDLEHENKYIVGRAFGTACYILNKGSNEALTNLLLFSKVHDSSYPLGVDPDPIIEESQKSILHFNLLSTSSPPPPPPPTTTTAALTNPYASLSPTKIKRPSNEFLFHNPSSSSSSTVSSKHPNSHTNTDHPTDTHVGPSTVLFSNPKSKFSEYKRKADGDHAKLYQVPKPCFKEVREFLKQKSLSPLQTDPHFLNPSTSFLHGPSMVTPSFTTPLPHHPHPYSTSPLSSSFLHSHLPTSATTTMSNASPTPHTSTTSHPPSTVVPGTNPRKPWIEQPVQLITLTSLPSNTLVHVGGMVSAKSVKLFGYEDTLHTREAWWQELREEIKSHAKSLQCTSVLGYTESTAIHDDLIVLCALGTAVNLDFKNNVPCRFLHIPYSRFPTPFPMAFNKCLSCHRRYVPQFLFTTLDPPTALISGSGVLIEALLGRSKKKKDGEANAANVSDVIPFTDYDLHKQLIEKLKKINKNAIFGLKLQLSVGDEFLLAVATGTAYSLQGLPLAPSSSSTAMPSSVQWYPVPDLSGYSSDSSFEDLPSLQHGPSNEDTNLSSLLPPTSTLRSNPELGLELSSKAMESSNMKLDTQKQVHESSFTGGGVGQLENEALDEDKEKKEKKGKVEMEEAEDDVHWVEQSSSQRLGDEAHVNAEARSSLLDSKDEESNEPAVMATTVSPFPSTTSSSSLPWLPLTPFPPMLSTKDLRTPSVGHQLLIVVKQASLQPKSQDVNQQLLQLFDTLYTQVKFELSFHACVLAGVHVDMSVVSPTQVQLRWSGVAFNPLHVSNVFSMPSTFPVQITPLSSIPGTHLHSYFGKLSLHFVKEANLTLSNYDHGGMGLFVQLFWAETLAVLGAHVQALGGNALVAFRIEHALFLESIKSQAYALISVSGDVCELNFEEKTKLKKKN